MAKQILEIAAGSPTNILLLDLAVDELEKMHEFKCNYDEVMFMLRMSDWPSSIIKIMRRHEGVVTKVQLKEQDEKLGENGLDEDQIKTKHNASKRWRLLQGIWAQSSYPQIKGEIDQVRQWQAIPGGDPPTTPALDRFQRLCVKLNVKFAFALKTLKLVKDRNAKAHHPPPDTKNHIKHNDKVDWNEIKRLCEDLKRELQVDLDEGSLDKDQVKLLEEMIDAWLSLHIQEWRANGDHLETDYGAKAHQTNPAAVSVAPDSFYEVDKWAYLSEVEID